MKLAILGTRGIPNNYGGFEQFAEYLAIGLTRRGHEVAVYCSHNHIYRQPTYEGVHLIHCYDPEYAIGTAGQFIYDLNCILDSRKRNFDVVLQLGYTSSSIFSGLFSKRTLVVTNMDGLEWKRSKYGKTTQKFLRYAESLAAENSDYLIADSIEIQKYLKNKYNKHAEYIAYGATVFDKPDESLLQRYKQKPYGYDMVIARLEPENNIDVILQGVSDSKSARNFLVIGKFKTTYGEYLVNKYRGEKRIIFVGPEYDMTGLNNLRYFSNFYFHGHSVGGTNPSLLEAMGSRALIAAHANDFNAAILGKDAYYFSNSAQVASLLESVSKSDTDANSKLSQNMEKIRNTYSWQLIIDQYEKFLTTVIGRK